MNAETLKQKVGRLFDLGMMAGSSDSINERKEYMAEADKIWQELFDEQRTPLVRWRVGHAVDLAQDDPYFVTEDEARGRAFEFSQDNSSSPFAVWRYEGDKATTMAIYVDGEAFDRRP